MKHKILKAVVCYITIIALLAGVSVGAMSATTIYSGVTGRGVVHAGTSLNNTTQNSDAVVEVQSLIDGIVSHKLKESGVTSVQQWIDGELTRNAGTTSEWYVIALSQNGTYDFKNYEKSLLKYLSDNQVYSAASRQKYALALMAAGSTDKYIQTTLNDSIGKQGVMSWVYGLHMLNNGYSSSEYTLQEVKSKLLSLQLADGGWAIMGSNGDVDVTAMTLQALVPHYNNDTAVKASVDKALTFLSERQLSTGDYASYGVVNPESTAQVFVALCSLGIDPISDSRFVKNGKTLLDGISNYHLPDGTFCHKLGEGYNENATVQVFFSMVSYLRMKYEKSPLYVLDARNPAGLSGNDEESSGAGESKGESVGDTEGETVGIPKQDYKLWVSLVIVIVAGLICVALHLAKKGNVKNYCLVGGIALIAVLALWLTNIQSVDSYYEEATASKSEVVGTVTLSIRCDTIVGKDDNQYVPSNGVILATEEYSFEEGDTVYDVLLEATAKHKIHMEITGSIDSAYVQGINHIYEFNYGELSGWMYYVNGESSSVSCGEHKLSDGDVIEWVYSCEMGKDIK